MSAICGNIMSFVCRMLPDAVRPGSEGHQVCDAANMPTNLCQHEKDNDDQLVYLCLFLTITAAVFYALFSMLISTHDV